jgi:hypothetical protein
VQTATVTQAIFKEAKKTKEIVITVELRVLQIMQESKKVVKHRIKRYEQKID